MRMIFRCDPKLAGHLVRPFPARSGLPDWLRAMPATAHSDIHGRDIRTVKQCPPFVDAMAYGIMIPLPCDVRIEAGEFSWDWDIPEPETAGHPRAPLSFHPAAQFAAAPFANGRSALKFNSFWTIELEPGWSLFATHPVNRDDLPFRLVSGLVDADRFHDGGINFPAVWTKPDFSGVLQKGRRLHSASPFRDKRRSWCSSPSTQRTSSLTRRLSATCWLRPTSTASSFARNAAA